MSKKKKGHNEEFSEEESPMAVIDKEVMDVKKLSRKQQIMELANKSCDRNDNALKRLSKN